MDQKMVWRYWLEWDILSRKFWEKGNAFLLPFLDFV